jgi:outer membrane receptor protein involved in Fe transport
VKIILALFISLTICFRSADAFSQNKKSAEIQETIDSKKNDDVDAGFFEVPFEDLVNIQIETPATITHLSFDEVPASVTVITSEDIKNTPARNIYDLIEVYVPGALWMDYEEGPKLGIRGNISSRNTKYLLRVNGRLMNNKAQYGATSELEQWDLADVQRIEVIRGPGSVTYGPGAVAGVINIITHDADSFEGLKISSGYIDKYDSRGVNISHGIKKDRYKMYSFASIVNTSGYGAPHYVGTNDNMPGYVGHGADAGSQPLDYFSDYRNDPQIKLHFNVDFLDHWRFWSRYTQQGSSWKGNEAKTLFPGHGFLNQQGLSNRQWTTALQYEKELREDLSLHAMLSIDSFDMERTKENDRHPDPGHALNKKASFSETEVLFHTVVNWQASEKVEVAFGGEYSWDYYGPGWGDGKNDMRLGPDGIIVSGPDSNAIDPGNGGSADSDGNAIFAGHGWDTHTYSLFSESNIKLTPQSKLLLSGRMDKNTYSDWLFSPRVALISEVADGHLLKFIVQQSQRMNTADELFALDENGNDSEAETLNALEIIYSTTIQDDLNLSIANFWHDAEVVDWNKVDEATTKVGDLQLFGVELELNYTKPFGHMGISYSYVEQLDWELADGVFASGISYSDYGLDLGGSDAIQRGVGNDLNNWANQAVKFFGRFYLNNKFTLHTDARVFWDFQGAKDGLEALANAVAGLPEEPEVLTAIALVNDEDIYDYDFRLNASLDYAINEHFSARVFVQNLIGSGNNKRYSYDSGNNKTSPSRVRFTEEPRTYGILMSYEF